MGTSSGKVCSGATDLQAACGCRVVVVAMCHKAEHTCDCVANTDFIFGNQPIRKMNVIVWLGINTRVSFWSVFFWIQSRFQV